MQVTETLNEGLKRKLEMSIPAADLASRRDARLNELKNRVQLKGFRPGKVPFNHLQKVYGRSAMSEVMQEAINASVSETLETRNERASMSPSVDLTEDQAEINKVIEGDADLSFSVSYEVLPKIEIADLSTFKIERPVVPVKDEDVEEQVKALFENYRTFEGKGEGAKIEDGDRAVIDFVGKIDGEVFEGGSATNNRIRIGAGQFIPGFEEGLVGLKAGEEKAIKVTFPDDYSADHLAGKKAEFEVKVVSIETPTEEVLGDEFAKRLGVDDMDKLRETVRGQIEGQHGDLTRRRVKRLVLDALDEAHQITVPENLVEQEFNGIWDRVKHEIDHHGRSFEDEGTTEDDARKDYQKIAERRVRLGLVVAEIGSANSIEVNDQELQQALVAEVRKYQGQEQQVYDYYRKNPNALAGLRAPIFEDKVVDHVLSLASVTDKEVDRDDLVKLLESDEEIDGGHEHHHHDHGDDGHDHEGHDHDHDHGDDDHDHKH